MDLSRTRQLAGISIPQDKALFRELNEMVQLPEDLTVEDLMQRMDACKRALSLCSKLRDPADKKKWLSATFVNLNKVRAALKHMIAQMEPETKAVQPTASGPGVSSTSGVSSTQADQGPSPSA
jgi:hypothetical protein